MGAIFSSQVGIAKSLKVENAITTNISISAGKTPKSGNVADSAIQGLRGNPTTSTDTSNTSLKDSFGPENARLGFVTTIQGGFSEAVSDIDSTGLVSVKLNRLGKFIVTGVAFNTSCDNEGRHGIEGVLKYYKDNRISENKHNFTIIQIGQTKLKGRVEGMSIAPLSSDFNLWNWSISLLVYPDFDAQGL